MSRALNLFRASRWRWGVPAALLALAVFLAWFFIFRGGSSSSPPAAAQPPARPGIGKHVSYAAYTAAISEAIRQVHDKQPQAAATTLETVEGAEVDTPAPNAATAQVDNTLLIGELTASSPDLPGVESSLHSLLNALHAQSKALTGTLGGEQASAQMREVLLDPAFNYERDLTPLQRLARWVAGATGNADPTDTLWQWLPALFAGLMSGTGTYLASERLGNRWSRLGVSSLVGLSVASLFRLGVGAIGTTIELLAAVGLVVAAVAAGLIASGVRRASVPSSRPRTLSELAVALGMGSAEARRKAESAAAEADYRLAIRYRCLAVLLALDEAGQLGFDRSATDREYLFRAHGSLHDELQPLLDRFSAVWYGDAPADAAVWQEVSAQAGKVEALSAEASMTRRTSPTRNAA